MLIITDLASHGDGISDLANALINKAKELGRDDMIEEKSSHQTGDTKIKIEERVIQIAVMGYVE